MNDALCSLCGGNWRLGSLIATTIVGGLIGLTACRPGSPVRPWHTTDEAVAVVSAVPVAPQLTADDVRRLIELKDTSIGRLENGAVGIGVGSDLDDAAEGFAQLAGDLPHERLPLRNLAIARLLLLQRMVAEEAQRRREARDAARRLLDLDPTSPIAHWIAASVELVPDLHTPYGTSDEAREKAGPLLRRATQLEPDNAVVWFALYRGVANPREPDVSEESKSALGRAYAANPRNIFLITEWLNVQAKTRDPAIVDTLANTRQALKSAEPTGRVVGLLENLRHADFRWTPFGAAYLRLGDPSCIALVEADGNVSWDLLSAGPRGVQLLLTATPQAPIVNYVRTERVEQQARVGVLAWDFDNDGFRDAAAWGATGLTVYRGGPQGKLQRATVVEGDLDKPVQMVRAADVDRDGDQDLLVATADRVIALLNQGGSGNNWLTLYPMGREDNRNRCNHHAIGSLVELRSGGWYQAQVVDSPGVYFGLGRRNLAEQVRILWTSGVPQDLVEVRGNVAICERMILKSSCPYIYTMADGTFSFFSDCLWGAPLGLQTAEGGVVPSRAWEYLRIPGERLTPTDGSYWIQLTEELWEAAYFDKVQLIAIDHPADVEIYSNEKVGPPEIAAFKIHTVRERLFPRSAVDQQGNDLRPQLQRCDGDFVKGFAQRIRQGLTPAHYIELDLGDLHDPQQITLFLTGWIYPTDTSLNIAFLQDPETDGPRMPSVWVKGVDGDWKETIAYMGYPGGKTKTIAVDLSDAFLTHDYHVRIQTTAEIYWDEVFFTVNETPAEVRQIALALESAELFYRGFSRPLPVQKNAPRMYDHADVKQSPDWPPMRGRFTRYGAVRDLLAEEDNQLAVIGAGDAVTVRFAVPDMPVPEGWLRDFVLHSVGWDKDADLNTIYGQNVEPLPFRAMRSYPFGPDEVVPDSRAYRDYLRRYQTREQNPQLFWRRLVLPDNDR